LPDQLPEVLADETRLRQILLNLVGNAIKFTPAGEVRVLAALGPDKMIEVSVEDSGPGIPEENLDKVFEEFEQVRTSADQMAKGTGLGLTICRRLVQLHGGSIRVSNRKDGGAVFSFTVPVFAGEETGA
jgi:signal transduction histidine kinase